MNKRFIIVFIITGLFIINFSLNLKADNSDDIIQMANNMAREADKLAKDGKISEAEKKFVEISEIFAKQLEKEPENKRYLSDYEHYLNQSGQVHLRYAKFMASRNKKYDIASKHYYLALKAFENALKKAPDSKVFKQNIQFAAYYAGLFEYRHALETHDTAPVFSIEDIKTKGKINLTDFKGGPVILKIWASWCPESRKDMDLMKKIYSKYKTKGLNIICISLDKVDHWGENGSVKRAIEISKKLPFYSGWSTNSLYFRYGALRSVPTIILLDKDLKMVKQLKSKERNMNFLSDEIDKLL